MPLSNDHSAATDELLASYAAGNLSRPLHVLIASHLSLNPGNRAYVSALEGLAASRIGDEAPLSPVADRGRRLAAIFADQDQPAAAAAAGGILPGPLSAYLGRPYDALSWRSVLPGLREVKLENSKGCEASLLWIRAGRAMPAHTHHGLEVTLVLKGSFSDSTGQYGRGDISVVDSDIDHKPVAGSGEDCICFAVSEGPARLTGPLGRLFSKLLRH